MYFTVHSYSLWNICTFWLSASFQCFFVVIWRLCLKTTAKRIKMDSHLWLICLHYWKYSTEFWTKKGYPKVKFLIERFYWTCLNNKFFTIPFFPISNAALTHNSDNSASWFMQYGTKLWYYFWAFYDYSTKTSEISST